MRKLFLKIFPYDNYEQACANAHLAGKYENPRQNVLAKSPATPMLFLLSAIGLIEESKAQG